MISERWSKIFTFKFPLRVQILNDSQKKKQGHFKVADIFLQTDTGWFWVKRRGNGFLSWPKICTWKISILTDIMYVCYYHHEMKNNQFFLKWLNLVGTEDVSKIDPLSISVTGSIIKFTSICVRWESDKKAQKITNRKISFLRSVALFSLCRQRREYFELFQ